MKPSALHKLEIASKSYSFNNHPSLYILTYDNQMSDKIIEKKEIPFPENSKLISVIFTGKINKVSDNINELIIPYKKRVEYVVADSESDIFGELSFVESLETAILWIFEGDYKYAILATCDYFSVRGIVYSVSMQSGLNLQFPIITEDMLFKMQINSKLSNASFSSISGVGSDFLDVRSLTIFDDDLSDCQVFKNLNESEVREMFSSYMKKNDYVTTGIGISRRTSKVWTPSKLKKIEVFGIAKKIITKLTEETSKLDLSIMTDSYCYFQLFSTKTFNRKELSNKEVDFYSKLLSLLYTTFKSQGQTILVDNIFITDIIKYCRRFGLNVVYEYECELCGRNIHRCRDCGSSIVDNMIPFGSELKCKSCGNISSIDDYSCDCGNPIEITNLLNHVFVYPNLDTVREIKEILNNKTRDVVNFSYFVLSLNQLKIISTDTNIQWQEIRLHDLIKWKTRAKINTITFSNKDEKRIQGYLKKAREKCPINNKSPRKEDCKSCESKTLTESDLKSGNICLLRLYGLAIEEFFDGIHHGYEKADIVYRDTLIDTQGELLIGIHFKSRGNVKKPIGRGHKNIKEVMSQFVYSLYMNSIGKYKFDVIGISIPNIIEENMRLSFVEVSKLFNTRFICLEEPDWYKIIAKAEENLIIDLV